VHLRVSIRRVTGPVLIVNLEALRRRRGPDLAPTIAGRWPGRLPPRPYGGIIALEPPLYAESALAIIGIFTEVGGIIAPDATEEAIRRHCRAARNLLAVLLDCACPIRAAWASTAKTVAGDYWCRAATILGLGHEAWRGDQRAPLTPNCTIFNSRSFSPSTVKVEHHHFAKDLATVGIGAEPDEPGSISAPHRPRAAQDAPAELSSSEPA